MTSSQTPLSDAFDAAVQRLTTDRGEVYGHPLDDFSKVVTIKGAVSSCPHPLIRHCLEMIGVKMARLAQSPDHLDSVLDIAGYSRCITMIQDEEKRRAQEDQSRRAEQPRRKSAEIRRR